MRIATPSPSTVAHAIEPSEQLSLATQPQGEEGEQAAVGHAPDQPDGTGRSQTIEDDARLKEALIGETMQQRKKRAAAGVGDIAAQFTLTRAINAALDFIRGKDRASTVDKADRLVTLTIDKKSPAWSKLSEIQTASQALLAAAITLHKEHALAVADGFIERLLDSNGERARSLPHEVSKVVDNETKRQRLSELAALLFCAARSGVSASTVEIRVDGDVALERFNTVLEGEALRRSMFDRPSLPEQELQGRVYFDGNALVNAVGKTASELAREPSLLSIPAYVRLSDAERLAAVENWFDERGLDRQYVIGTVENAMASVLKSTALARGKPAPGPYATEADLNRAFITLVYDWQQADGALIDPRVLLGLNLAKSRGISLAGNTPPERLDDLFSFVNDILTEYAGPPRFDKRAVALEALMVESGLSEAELTRPLGATGKSVLDTFFEQSKLPQHSNAIISTDSGTRISVSSVAGRVETAESTFKSHGQLNTPYVRALARRRLRMEKVPLTDSAIDAKVAEIARRTQQQQLNEANIRDPWFWLRKAAQNVEPMNISVFAEGVRTGNLDQVLNSVPVLSNLRNIDEALSAGDFKHAGMAAVTLVPVVGKVATIKEGVNDNDLEQVVDGIMGFAVDCWTLSQGGVPMPGERGRTRSIVFHPPVGETGAKPQTIPRDAINPRLKIQADQSLTALADLGFTHDHWGLKIDRSGETSMAVSRPAPSVSVMPSRDAARIAKQLKGYEVATPPATLRRSGSGMLWNPDTAAHYAEFEGKTYRLAPDAAKTTPQRPIWNVVSPDGSNRVMTLPLEYVFDRETRAGRWQIAKDYPTLRGGGLFDGKEVPILTREEWNSAQKDGIDRKLIEKMNEVFEDDLDVRVFSSRGDERVYLIYDKYDREYFRVDNNETFSPDPVGVYDYEGIRTWRVTNEPDAIPPGVIQVPIEKIVPSRSRESLNEARLQAVLSRIKDGQKLDAVKATFDSKSGRYHLDDGNHRYYAAQDLSLTQIPIRVAEDPRLRGGTSE